MTGRKKVEKKFGPYCFEIWPEEAAYEPHLRLLRNDDDLQLASQTLYVLKELLDPKKSTGIVPSSDIYDACWGPNSKTDPNIVQKQISLLRGIFREDGDHYIQHAGTGYRFTEPYVKTEVPILSPPMEQKKRVIETEGRVFDDFFGKGVSNNTHDGVIVLQQNDISEFLSPETVKREISNIGSRFYKARMFTSASDLHAGTLLQRKFRDSRFRPPMILLSKQGGFDKRFCRSSFFVSLGLGFTNQTELMLESEESDPWICIDKEFGDAVALHPKLVSESFDQLKPNRDGKDGFVRLYPRAWGAKYASNWESHHKVDDYAIILRNTEIHPGGSRTVCLIIAGFTERSTIIGAYYLAEHLESITDNLVRDRLSSPARGDFLMFIHGLSDTNVWERWTEIEDLRITPEKLKTLGVEGDWSKRKGL